MLKINGGTNIVSYDGVTGRYGAYFRSDGEVIFIEPNDKNVLYLD